MTVKASLEVLAELEELLNSIALGLTKVNGKTMFGCHALWANENVFALVWKEGRIGLKLTDENDFSKLLNLPGAVPWKAGAMTMSHWVLVPKSFHEKKSALAAWAKKAHAQALTAPRKKVGSKKKTAKKKKA